MEEKRREGTKGEGREGKKQKRRGGRGGEGRGDCMFFRPEAQILRPEQLCPK